MGYLPYQLVSRISESSTVAPENGWLEYQFPFWAPAYAIRWVHGGKIIFPANFKGDILVLGSVNIPKGQSFKSSILQA